MAKRSHRSELLIPKILQFVWLPEIMPADVELRMGTWLTYHSDWHVLLLNKLTAPPLRYLASLFEDTTSPVIRSRIIGWEALYQFGGVLVDLDMECRGPMDELIPNCPAFVAREPGGLRGGKIIGCREQHILARSICAKAGWMLEEDNAAEVVDYCCEEQKSSVTVFKSSVFFPEGEDELATSVSQYRGPSYQTKEDHAPCNRPSPEGSRKSD